ncbi:MAG TPA: type II secretion system F family protein [Micromonosporaceae bacterium]
MSDQLLLFGGLTALFLAFALAAATVVLGATGRTGIARALADIDQVYAPSGIPARDETFVDRAVTPAVRALSAIGRVLTPQGGVRWLERWLDYAGNPPAWPASRVFEVQGIGLVAVGLIGGLVGWALSGSVVVTLVAVVVGALIGLCLPFGVLYDAGQRRQSKIRSALPDFLDMLTLCVEAGLGFDAALAQVAGRTAGPLAGEIARALHEMRIGNRRADAMRAIAERTTVTELRTFTTAVVQASELGIPVAQVLREQAHEMRVRRRQRAEERAQKVTVKMVFPLVLCLFPALFIVILGPGVLRIVDTLLR